MRVQPTNNFGRAGVKFRTFAEAVKARIGQFIEFGREGRFVQTEIIGEEIVERFLAGIIGGIFEDLCAEILGEAHDFKKVAVAIAGHGGDAHAGKNFSQAGVDGRASFLHAARFERFREFIREIRQHGTGTSGHKQGDMVRVKNLRRFHN